jgi:hypothetical protein
VTPEPPKTRSRIDADGVKTAPAAGMRGGLWLILLAAVLVGAAGLLALRLALPASPPEPEPEAAQLAEPGAAVAAAPGAPAAAAPARRTRAVRREAAPPEPLPPGSTQAPRPEPPSLPEIPDDPHGDSAGIGVFPPMGTDPPKVGLLVPEDFELPEGYVRHYQATDDGEQLPAILMFHPDFVWIDQNGNQIPLPPDLIVPPEMAPPGLPPEFIEIPPPLPDEAPVP